jgi:hypothetical protein
MLGLNQCFIDCQKTIEYKSLLISNNPNCKIKLETPLSHKKRKKEKGKPHQSSLLLQAHD